jgi:hypothetical protein
MTTHHHLYAIGNALVDSEYEVSDAQLQAAGVEKRHMTLIDAHRRTELLHHVQGVHARRTGGGSAGNTAVALAQLGGRAFYSCRVADDELGDFLYQGPAFAWRGHQPHQHPGAARANRQLHGDGHARRRAQHEHLFGSNG